MEPEESAVYQRLNFLVTTLEKGSQSDFARRIGVKSGVVGDMFGKRRNKPSFDVLGKIALAYPQLRVEWLLTGEGEMLKSTEEPKKNFVYSHSDDDLGDFYHDEEGRIQSEQSSTEDALRILTVQVGLDGEENIEVVNTRAAAGYAHHRIEREYIRKLPSFRLPSAQYNGGSFRCFQVSGDSMSPTLHEGDWLICRYVEKWAHHIRDNRVYVVVTEEDVLVKRVINTLNERGHISLLSDNRAFGLITMDVQQVREVWEGVGRLTRQLRNTQVDVPDELARQRASLEELWQRLDRLEARDNPSGEE